MEKDKDILESIFNDILDVLEKNEVSPEDGAVISANLFLSALSALDNDTVQSLAMGFTDVLTDEFHIAKEIIPHNRIGVGRGWGLDPSLLEDN